MALTSDQITAQNFADFYTTIKPYLNGGGFKMTKLWENPNPTTAMSASTEINLSSSDYDMLLFIVKESTLIAGKHFNTIVLKGQSAQTFYRDQDNNGSRTLTYSADTKYIAEQGYYYSTGLSSVDTQCVPIAIYGIKLYAYDNISCVMMSSTWEAGQTTVEFTDPIIDGDSIFDVYLPSQYADLIYSSLSVSGHTLTITFPSAQASDIEVKLRVNRG